VSAILATVTLLTGCTEPQEPAKPLPANTATSSIGITPTATQAPDSGIGSTIEPVLVVASVDVDGEHVTASGYVSGIVKDGGTCRFVFTGNGETVSVDRQGTADRSSTSCGTVQPEIDKFDRGTWSVILEYRSDGHVVDSAPETVEIP
jgi:hypothetical protein